MKKRKRSAVQRAKDRSAARRRYALRRKQRVCVKCKAPNPVSPTTGKPMVRCQPCQRILLRWRETHQEERLFSARKCAAARYDDLRAIGFCVACGSAPRGRTVRCDACAEAHNARYRKPGAIQKRCRLCKAPGHNARSCFRELPMAPADTLEHYATARVAVEF